jgi:hypothetical protein
MADSKSDSIEGMPHLPTDTERGTKEGVAEVYPDHTHLSVGDIFRGTAEAPPTPFEQKAALINE